jgi:hypothetical protein
MGANTGNSRGTNAHLLTPLLVRQLLLCLILNYMVQYIFQLV